LHTIHGDMKENVSGCFFSEHSVVLITMTTLKDGCLIKLTASNHGMRWYEISI